MKQQYGMKRIPGELGAWLESSAYVREVELNTLICQMLEHYRTGRHGDSPLETFPVRKSVKFEVIPDRPPPPVKD